MNGYTLGFQPQMRKIEPPCTTKLKRKTKWVITNIMFQPNQFKNAETYLPNLTGVTKGLEVYSASYEKKQPFVTSFSSFI